MSWQTYKNDIQVPRRPVGDAGINLKDNFKKLRDYAPKSVFDSEEDPDSEDNFAAGWEVGSVWVNASTRLIWRCTGDGIWEASLSTGNVPSDIVQALVDSADLEEAQIVLGVPATDESGNLEAIVIHRQVVADDLDTFIPEDGELAIVTDTHTVIIGDGSTAGGFAMGIPTTAVSNNTVLPVAGGSQNVVFDSNVNCLVIGRINRIDDGGSDRVTIFGDQNHVYDGESTILVLGTDCVVDDSGAANVAIGTGVFINTLVQGAIGIGAFPIIGVEAYGAIAIGFGSVAGNVSGSAGPIAIGDSSVASTSYTVALGSNATATAIGAIAIGFASATGAQSFAMGRAAVTVPSQRAYSSLSGAASTQATVSETLLTCTTVDTTTPTQMRPAADAAASLSVPTNTAMTCQVHIIAAKTDGSKIAEFWRRVLIKNVGGTTTLIGSSDIGTDVDPDGWGDPVITADDTADAIKIMVTGPASGTVRWRATVTATQAFFG